MAELEAPKGKKFYEMSKEELSACGKAGAVKSAETRRRKRAMKDSLDLLLNMPLKSGKQCDVETVKNFAALKGKNITVEQAMLIAQIQKALKGDTQALTFLRDTSGQKPEDNLNVVGQMDISNPYDELTVDELKALAKKCESDAELS